VPDSTHVVRLCKETIANTSCLRAGRHSERLLG
jgi:hypothetical protein